jgi:uncharacterized membrane protein YgaE (UPF0421/DUF939 family)
MQLFKRKDVIAHICVKVGDNLKIIKTKRLCSNETSFSYANREYIISLQDALIKNNKFILLYDINNPAPIKFNAEGKKYNAELLKTALSVKVAKLIFPSTDNTILLVGAILLIGGIAGILFGIYMYSQNMALSSELTNINTSYNMLKDYLISLMQNNSIPPPSGWIIGK